MASMYFSEDAFKPDQSPAALVNEGWDKAQAYASTAFNSANEFLDEIGNLSGQIADFPDVTGNVALPSGTITPFAMPDAPTRPDGLTVAMPAAPSEPSLGAVPDFSVGNAPNFTAQMPALNLGMAEPSPIAASLPGDPELNAVPLPDAPSLVIPEMADLQAIVIPDVPVINIPTFDVAMQEAPLPPAFVPAFSAMLQEAPLPPFFVPAFSAMLQEAPLPPSFDAFAFAEETYTSDLLSALKARLLEWVNRRRSLLRLVSLSRVGVHDLSAGVQRRMS